MTDGGENNWHYFTGAEGNARGYKRGGCQFYDGKKWRRCFSGFGLATGCFDPTKKYRRPISAPIPPLEDALLPVQILLRHSDTWAVVKLKGGKFAWLHDGKVELADKLTEFPFVWFGWPGPADTNFYTPDQLYSDDPCAKILIEGLK